MFHLVQVSFVPSGIILLQNAVGGPFCAVNLSTTLSLMLFNASLSTVFFSLTPSCGSLVPLYHHLNYFCRPLMFLRTHLTPLRHP